MSGMDEKSFKVLLLEEEDYKKRVVQTKIWNVKDSLEHLHKQEDHDWHMERFGRCVYCMNGSRIASREEINGRINK